MSALDVVAVGERALRFRIPSDCPREALLAWLLAQPDVADASLAAEHALVVFHARPRPIVLPTLAPLDRSRVETLVVRVAYDGEDLDEVAALAACTRERVIAMHASRELTVSFLGFCPGFAYLVGLDPALAAVPRRQTPRPRVPPSSVALAGGYSAIYPAASAGGWRLLGRALDAPMLEGDAPRLRVGDRVRFEPA